MNPLASSPDDLRTVDRQLLVAMRNGDWFSIGELTDALGVTATAIRQRIDRLSDMGLIGRQKIVAGRGRPTYRYQLTATGHRTAGANPGELADAMWREILEIPDSAVRQDLLGRVAARLGRQFAAEIASVEGDGADGGSLEQRVARLTEMMTARHMAAEASMNGDLPVLDVSVCPYPSLTDVSDDRQMCRLEEQMISEALGVPVHLSSCRLDGDSCCQFTATQATSGAGPPTVHDCCSKSSPKS